jgi:hypothetical protein
VDRALARSCEPLTRSQPERSLGRDLVQELLELVDDLFGVLDLVLELDRALLDHVLGGEDRAAVPDRDAPARRRDASRSRPPGR